MLKMILAGGVVAFSGLVYLASTVPQQAAADLHRVDCADLTIFALKNKSSDADICRSYGGLAEVDAKPSAEGLVILVRNRPMGGFEGATEIR